LSLGLKPEFETIEPHLQTSDGELAKAISLLPRYDCPFVNTGQPAYYHSRQLEGLHASPDLTSGTDSNAWLMWERTVVPVCASRTVDILPPTTITFCPVRSHISGNHTTWSEDRSFEDLGGGDCRHDDTSSDDVTSNQSIPLRWI
jgi:hypothetical protein